MHHVPYSVVTIAAMNLQGPVRVDEFLQVLVTPTYRVTIIERCKDEIVACSSVEYVGFNRKTKELLTLKGNTNLVMCADGVRPCHVGDYEFRSGEHTYVVYPQGALRILKGESIVVSENGEWVSQVRPSARIDEMTCGRFQVTAFADVDFPKFGILLSELEGDGEADRQHVRRSYVFPDTQAEFDFRVAPTSVYCELRENFLFIYGRGHDEGGDVVFRVRLDTLSWEYDFSRVRVGEEPN